MHSRQPLIGAWLLPLLLPLAASAQTAPPPATPASAPPQQVEVRGERESDLEQRRRSTAAKIVIGREEIERQGDSSLGEILRRLPGVSTPGRPGRGGPPRLRGLGGGYTQLLIDGERVPPGFSLESLPPEQVERIEIQRAPTAETGARAIAGTINIILREGYRRRLNDLRLGVAEEGGAWGSNAGWTRNHSAGELTATLSASAFATRRLSSESTTTRRVDLDDDELRLDQTDANESQSRRRGLHLHTRLQWRLGGGGDQLVLAPNLFHAQTDTESLGLLDPRVDADGLAAYAESHRRGSSRFTSLRLNGQWRQQLSTAVRGEANGFASGWHSVNGSRRDEADATGLRLRTLDDDSRSREASLKLGAKFTALLGGSDAEPGSEHQGVAGAEVEAIRRRDERSQRQDGVELLADFGDTLAARSTRWALYAQDEWSLTPNWALHLGLRGETIETVGDPGDGTHPRNRSSVWTPLVHALWKPDPKGRDQVRISLTRSYRSPPLAALIARPAINACCAVDTPNRPSAPDRAGNPGLRPELAAGVDLAFERYPADGGLLSANLFARRIKDLMRSVTTLETVPWSTVPRYVARQRNIGDATTLGLELEARLRLEQLLADAPRADLRANLALYRSRVDGVPGPDNRLDEQAGATANVGIDHRLRSLPLMVGANLNWVPGYRTRLDAAQVVEVNTRRVFDAYLLWTIDPSAALRLSAGNLAPRTSVDTRSITLDGVQETALTTAPSSVNWQLRLELKL